MEKGQLRPPVLVFVQEKDRAKDLFNELIKEKIHVDVIHSERSQLQRDNSVRAFRAGQIWVLICTELMGRGIDFKVSKFVTIILILYNLLFFDLVSVSVRSAVKHLGSLFDLNMAI